MVQALIASSSLGYGIKKIHILGFTLAVKMKKDLTKFVTVI